MIVPLMMNSEIAQLLKWLSAIFTTLRKLYSTAHAYAVFIAVQK